MRWSDEMGRKEREGYAPTIKPALPPTTITLIMFEPVEPPIASARRVGSSMEGSSLGGKVPQNENRVAHLSDGWVTNAAGVWAIPIVERTYLSLPTPLGRMLNK